VKSRVDGQLVKVNYQEGNWFSRDPLVEIDSGTVSGRREPGRRQEKSGPSALNLQESELKRRKPP